MNLCFGNSGEIEFARSKVMEVGIPIIVAELELLGKMLCKGFPSRGENNSEYKFLSKTHQAIYEAIKAVADEGMMMDLVNVRDKSKKFQVPVDYLVDVAEWYLINRQ